MLVALLCLYVLGIPASAFVLGRRWGAPGDSDGMAVMVICAGWPLILLVWAPSVAMAYLAKLGADSNGPG